MRDLKRGHIFGAGLDRWIEGDPGKWLEDEVKKTWTGKTDDQIAEAFEKLRTCGLCGRTYVLEGDARDPICPDCIEATAVPEGDDGR